MAEDEELLDDDDDDELNWIAIGVALVVILALIGGSVWYFFLRVDPDEAAGIVRPQWEPPEVWEEEEIIDLLPDLVISPYDSQGRYYLLLKLTFSVGDREAAMEFALFRPGGLERIQNIIIDIYSSYTLNELRQPKFKEEARQNLKDRLNELAGWPPPEMQGMPEEDLPKPPVIEIYYEKYILN